MSLAWYQDPDEAADARYDPTLQPNQAPSPPAPDLAALVLEASREAQRRRGAA